MVWGESGGLSWHLKYLVRCVLLPYVGVRVRLPRRVTYLSIEIIFWEFRFLLRVRVVVLRLFDNGDRAGNALSKNLRMSCVPESCCV